MHRVRHCSPTKQPVSTKTYRRRTEKDPLSILVTKPNRKPLHRKEYPGASYSFASFGRYSRSFHPDQPTTTIPNHYKTTISDTKTHQFHGTKRESSTKKKRTPFYIGNRPPTPLRPSKYHFQQQSSTQTKKKKGPLAPSSSSLLGQHPHTQLPGSSSTQRRQFGTTALRSTI